MSTEPPGSLAPTSPSVDANWSTTGTPNPASIASRSSGVSGSLVELTASGAISQPARPRARAPARRACPGSPSGAPARSLRASRPCAPAAPLRARPRTGTAPRLTTAAAKPVEWIGDAAATIATGTPTGGRPPSPPAAPTRRRMIEAPKSAYSPNPCTNTPRRPELPPEARQTYSSSSRLGVCGRGRQMRLDRPPAEPPVGDDLVERVHHLAPCASPAAAAGRRARTSADRSRASRRAWNGERSIARREQLAQPLALVRGEPLRVPVEPLGVARDAAPRARRPMRGRDRLGRGGGPRGHAALRARARGPRVASQHLGEHRPAPARRRARRGLAASSRSVPAPIASTSSAMLRAAASAAPRRSARTPTVKSSSSASTRALVQGRVAPVQLRVAGGVDPELDHQQRPLGLAAVHAGEVLEQRRGPPVGRRARRRARRSHAPARRSGRSSSARNRSALPSKREYTAPFVNPASSAICSSVAPW